MLDFCGFWSTIQSNSIQTYLIGNHSTKYIFEGASYYTYKYIEIYKIDKNKTKYIIKQYFISLCGMNYFIIPSHFILLQ